MTLLLGTLGHAVTITAFVLTMMVLIEYINAQTRGLWQEGLRRSGWKQYAVALTLGALPGCLGAFTVVSLYAHGTLSFGALVGTMVATSGDESFVMLAMFPGKALALMAALFVPGLVMAVVTDRLLPRLAPPIPKEHRLQIHDVEECRCFQADALVGQLHHMTFARALLLGFFAFFLLGLLSGFLVPESGPHLAFVTLYSQGILPVWILVASSIVQDGHGTLPLLAASKDPL